MVGRGVRLLYLLSSAPASSGMGGAAGPSSRKALGAGLSSKAVADNWDMEPHRG